MSFVRSQNPNPNSPIPAQPGVPQGMLAMNPSLSQPGAIQMPPQGPAPPGTPAGVINGNQQPHHGLPPQSGVPPGAAPGAPGTPVIPGAAAAGAGAGSGTSAVSGGAQRPSMGQIKSAQQFTPRLQELLEQLTTEYMHLHGDNHLRGPNGESADPKLIQQHMNDLHEIRKTIFELHQAHQQLREQYNNEVAKLRSKLDELMPAPPIVGRQEENESEQQQDGSKSQATRSPNNAPQPAQSAAPTSASQPTSQPTTQPTTQPNAVPREVVATHVPGPVVPPGQEESNPKRVKREHTDTEFSEQAEDGGNGAQQPPVPVSNVSNAPTNVPAVSGSPHLPSQAPPAPHSHASLPSASSVQAAPHAGNPPNGTQPAVPAPAVVPPVNVPQQQPLPVVSGSTTAKGVQANGAPASPNSPNTEKASLAPLDLAALNFQELPAQFKTEGSDYKIVYNPHIPRRLSVEQLHSLPHNSVVCCVRFSQDGKYLATGCNHVAQIYDVATGQLCVRLHDASADEGKDLYIRSVCFSPDGRYLATGAEDHKVRIWDIQQRELVHTLQGHAQEIYSLAYTNNGGRYLVSGSGDRFVKVWDCQSGQVLREFQIEDGVTAVAVSSDDRFVAAGSLDRKIRIWNIETGELVERLGGAAEDGHQDSVYSVAYMPNGHELVSGSLDRTVKVWELGAAVGGGPNAAQNSHVKMTIQGPSNYVLSVAVTPDSRYIMSGSKDQCVHMWDAESGVVQLMLQAHTNSVISVAPSPDGKYFASGGGDYMAKIWRYETH